MNVFRQVFKFVGVLLLVVIYLLFAMPLYPFLKFRIHGVRPWISSWVGWIASMMLWVLGIRVSYTGVPLENLKDRTFLIVSNHLSYLDVLTLSKKFNASFVTSVEIRDTPGLGQICIAGGCLFVERRNRKRLNEEVAEITDALKRGFNVAIFPEATSTNGETVLRFKRPLFQAALTAQRPVLPVAIHYRKIDETPVHTGNRDTLCWYGDMSFFTHLWHLSGIRSAEMEIRILPEISTGDEALSCADLAEQAQTLVRDAYSPISDLDVSANTQKISASRES